MAGIGKWKDTLKNELEKSPLASNLFVTSILYLLEMLLDVEFSCPCVSLYNAAFTSAFFIVPGILSFTLLMRIRGYKCDKSALLCFIPSMVWFTLVFLDGQYYACAMTYWSGSYEKVPQYAHLKWCKPDNTSHKTSEELQAMTQGWFSTSQLIGMVCVGILIVVAALYHIMIQKCFKENNQDQGPSSGDENTEMPLTAPV